MCRRKTTTGYAQAIKIGNTIHVSGQLSHDDNGTMIAPAALDDPASQPADFSMMAEQMRVTYANAADTGPVRGALDHVVEEMLYVPDVDEAFAVAGKVRKEAYAQAGASVRQQSGRVSKLAFPEQLIEIIFKAASPARRPRAASPMARSRLRSRPAIKRGTRPAC